MVKFQGNTAQMRYRSLASYHPRYIHQFPHKSIRVIAKGSAVLPSRKSAEPFSSYKVIPAPATHSRHSTHQNSTNAAAAIILLPNRQSCFEKVRVFKTFQPFGDYSHSILAGGLVVTSSTTRFTCGTSLTILAEIVRTTSYGMRAQSAVMKSSVVTARMATV